MLSSAPSLPPPSKMLPLIVLAHVQGSFPFSIKHLSLARRTIVTLGSEYSDVEAERGRVAAFDNGWFPGGPESGRTPLNLSTSHAQLWADEEQIYIRDLGTPFGTFVNGQKISAPTLLKNGDIITLGRPVTRNEKTPTSITPEELLSIEVQVSILLPLP